MSNPVNIIIIHVLLWYDNIDGVETHVYNNVHWIRHVRVW